MKHITTKGRLLLRRILTLFSLGAVSFIFQACYGPPMSYISGTVKCSETQNPLEGIQVNNYNFTDSDGNFAVHHSQDRKTILEFRDPDENYYDKDVTVDTRRDQVITVYMDPK